MLPLIPYAKFRTGETYRSVCAMLWSPSDDPRTWRHKSRGVVLGRWHQIKREMYADYVHAHEAFHLLGTLAPDPDAPAFPESPVPF
jgi:hypothetical protein